MSKMKKTEKLQTLILENLIYLRLRADEKAIEEEIEENRPLEEKGEGKGIAKKVNELITDAQNLIRSKKVELLTEEKFKVGEELYVFAGEHSEKELQYANEPKKLEKLLKKYLKKDKQGFKKLELILAVASDERYSYQRPEKSMRAISAVFGYEPDYADALYEDFCKNLRYLQKNPADRIESAILLGMGVTSLLTFSLMGLGATGLGFWASQKRRFRKSMETLSDDGKRSLFALRLTQVKMMRKELPEEEWKELADGVLKEIDNYRADAEYEWLVEGVDAPACKDRIALCELCIDRFATTVGV